ncbi:MAG: hypothetical protein CMM46_17660 [Rhodospirillaceae bacterium]|nr:hypothetical protein [Rhodospirillaceae bacterium]
MILPDSLWAASAAPAVGAPPLKGRNAADVVVIGGGFTGLSTALHLAEAGKSVIVLEAGEPGWCASGRNGGQVNPGWRMLPSEITAKYGRNRGPAVLDMLNKACDAAFDVISRHGIDCDVERPGFVHAGFDPLGKAFLDGWIREWGELGLAVERYDRAGLQEFIGTDFYHFAKHDPRGGHLQPLSYARGLARAAITQGATIHGHSRVDALHQKGGGWQVVTKGGSVDTEHIVICTNAYSDRLWPNLRKSIIPISTQGGRNLVMFPQRAERSVRQIERRHQSSAVAPPSAFLRAIKPVSSSWIAGSMAGASYSARSCL